MKYCLVLCLMMVLALGSEAKEGKEAKKNRKIVAKENSRFQKNLEKHPNSAHVFLDHANKLATLTSEAPKAPMYYQQALKLDTANAATYKGYGIFLFDKMKKYPEAKKMLDQSNSLAPNDEEVKKYLASVNNILAGQDAENQLKDFGRTSVKELNPSGDMAVMTKFDSLRNVVSDSLSPYFYPGLLRRYMHNDTTLRPDEMYMMIIGFSKQPGYNPFNYNPIIEMKMIANHSIDEAIFKGEELAMEMPINPSLNRELMYYYRKKNDTVKANKYLNRVRLFFSGVLYSGNGSCQRPYISLWAKEEYNFITYLGNKPTDNHSMGMCAGKMAEIIDQVEAETQKTTQVYFNVALIYMQAVGK